MEIAQIRADAQVKQIEIFARMMKDVLDASRRQAELRAKILYLRCRSRLVVELSSRHSIFLLVYLADTIP